MERYGLNIRYERNTHKRVEHSTWPSAREAIDIGQNELDIQASARGFEVERLDSMAHCAEPQIIYRESSWRRAQ